MRGELKAPWICPDGQSTLEKHGSGRCQLYSVPESRVQSYENAQKKKALEEEMATKLPVVRYRIQQDLLQRQPALLSTTCNAKSDDEIVRVICQQIFFHPKLHVNAVPNNWEHVGEIFPRKPMPVDLMTCGLLAALPSSCTAMCVLLI